MEYDRRRVKILLNRANTNVGIEREDVLAILGRDVDILIPSDRDITRSINQGAPIALQRGSEAAKAFRSLAELYVDEAASVAERRSQAQLPARSCRPRPPAAMFRACTAGARDGAPRAPVATTSPAIATIRFADPVLGDQEPDPSGPDRGPRPAAVQHRDRSRRRCATRVQEELRERLDQEPGISREDRERLVDELTDDILGHGPLERLLDDDTVTEIMVNGPYDIWVERAGRLHKTPVRFTDESHLRRIISKIVAQVGRRIDESSPMVDARLPDGSRVNATIPPLSLTGPLLTIRKFGKHAARHGRAGQATAR